MTAAAFLASLPFTPDPFQSAAVAAITAGRSVVVTAPTGAGKTLIAEAAIHEAFAAGERAFYTTPIKALSNQKYHDLVAALGAERVGLLTGDTSLNGGAAVVVMTTEVLRNMIYAKSADLADVGVVVLDEVHYLADRARGAVWEEVIIHAPPSTRLVCLSATISNPGEFTDWVRERRGDVELVVTRERPVPLEPIYGMKDRWADDRVTLRPVLVDGKANRAILHQLAERTQGRQGKRPPPRRFVTPRRLETVDALEAHHMLPAIYFIFSRAGCEQAAATLATVRGRLPAPIIEQISVIAEAGTRHVAPSDLAALDHDAWLDRLTRGVAAHHAGMVPAFKEVVERCFAEGLLDVVFATETLALGINMPARAVVLEALTKFDGEGHEPITASEYTQLTGRAGRRGIDEVGYGVVLHSPWVRFERVVDLVGTGASPLASSFRPTYNMAVNLVANYPRDRAEQLLEASFAQFGRRRSDDAVAAGLSAVREELEAARATAACHLGDIWEFLAAGGVEGGGSLPEGLRPGDVLDVPGGARPGRYVVLARATDDPVRLQVLSAGGKLARLPPDVLVPGTAKLGWLTWKGPFRPRDKQFLRATTQRLRSFVPTMHTLLDARDPAVPHPVADCPDLATHRAAVATVQRLERRLEAAGLPASGSLVAEFRAVLDLLDARGYLDGWSLGPSGSRLRTIYSERDLLVAETLSAGLLDDLGPGDLAAVLSGFVFDPRGEGAAPDLPTAAAVDAAAGVVDLWSGLHADERRRRLTETRPPEFGFARTAFAWATGADLDDVLEVTPVPIGDFVRVSRQLLDLLRQVRDAAPHLAPIVAAAIGGVDRGVVAAGAP